MQLFPGRATLGSLMSDDIQTELADVSLSAAQNLQYDEYM
jgi:hypothetical protein